MGCSATREAIDFTENNKHINLALEGAEIEQQRVTKLLLLGSGTYKGIALMISQLVSLG